MKNPSVSKILDFIFYNNYDDIPDFIMKKAKRKGNCFHKMAEIYIKTGEVSCCICPKLVKSHEQPFEWLINDVDSLSADCEVLSEGKIYGDDLTGVIDLIILENNITTLVEFKTGSKISMSKWSYQLYMYAYLHNGSWNIDWNKYNLEVWWYNLKNKKSIIVKIPQPKPEEIEEIKEAILNYEEVD